MGSIETSFTKMMGCQYPIIGAPMFLVSDEDLVVAVSEAGGVGTMPSLNWRTPEEFRKAVQNVKARTQKPFGVNIIVNQANPRVATDLQICVDEKVPMIITSLGNPKDVIKKMHAVGSKVFCDVVDLKYSLKVQELGADGVIAVSTGAGGHAGPVSPLVLLPYLHKYLKIPVIAAGGIVTGQQAAATFLLGAAAVQIGTRFIATPEAKVDDSYKNAILSAQPEDIVMTNKLSGTPCAVIRTPYIDKIGTNLSFLERTLLKNPKTKKYMKLVRTYIGSEALKKAVTGPTYKEVWSAGQSVGLIEKIQPAAEIVAEIAADIKRFWKAPTP